MEAIDILFKKIYPNNVKNLDFYGKQKELNIKGIFDELYGGENCGKFISIQKTEENDYEIRNYKCDKDGINETEIKTSDRIIQKVNIIYLNKDRVLQTRNNYDNFYNPINALIKEKNKEIESEEEKPLLSKIKEVVELLQKEIADNIMFLPFDISNIYKYGGFYESKVVGEEEKINIPLKQIGSGIEQFYAIKFLLKNYEKDNEVNIILIDEPELSLHPNYQNKLIEELSESKNIQIILTSHSPTFVKHCMNDKNCEVLICKKEKPRCEKCEKMEEPCDNCKNKEDILITKEIKEYIKNKKWNFLKNYTNSQAVANFLAFGEYSTDLHNLLYGLLDEKFKDGKITTGQTDKLTKGDDYYWQRNDGQRDSPLCKYLTYFIRNKIHHPENHLNDDKTPAKEFDKYYKQSIDEMIEVLKNIDNK